MPESVAPQAAGSRSMVSSRSRGERLALFVTGWRWGDWPAAWLLMKDGKTVKRINSDGQAQGIPAAGRIKMYRAAIKAVAQGGAINAAMILYTGRINEDSDTQALVIEHEHRLGVSANKVVGYEVQSGQILWGEPVTQSKPYEWFYTEKDSNS